MLHCSIDKSIFFLFKYVTIFYFCTSLFMDTNNNNAGFNLQLIKFTVFNNLIYTRINQTHHHHERSSHQLIKSEKEREREI